MALTGKQTTLLENNYHGRTFPGAACHPNISNNYVLIGKRYQGYACLVTDCRPDISSKSNLNSKYVNGYT